MIPQAAIIQKHFGLNEPPTEREIQAFIDMARRLAGIKKESIAEILLEAACITLKGVDPSHLFSQSDTLEMILKLLEQEG